ncbi:hypothetical protein Poli38472_005526 [Pythium oligandrum]|uniref:STIL N-terminal domain-containing protein n=1 Tax=Pythium oligandrum TaxID=41045 RepID=A0A8K1FLQ0_PYTOL|nr:hypothetical protein Poli38472_005526 [Pythium oligandrum]|eukprot:TMW62908.1 hypothetical protein Poli38472_005526 [Pythium oligandrum]
MATSSVRPPRAFSRYDAAQSSDRTFTGLAASQAAWQRRSGVASRLPSARRGRSTFFPDSTDDEDGNGRELSVVREEREERTLRRVQTAPVSRGSLGLPVGGEIHFPLTRKVLWDRRVLAGPFVVTTGDVLPRVVITNSVLKEIYALCRDLRRRNGASSSSVSQVSSRRLCFVRGEQTDRELTITRVENDADETQATWRAPVFHSRPRHHEDEERLEEQMINTTKRALETMETTRTNPIEASLVVNAPPLGGGSRAEMEIEMEVALPCAKMQLALIRNLPLLMTPLAMSLSRREFGSARRCGFMTLDRARKAVPLLESDPMARQRPIVGLWVYGVSVEGSVSGDCDTFSPQLRLDHPFLYECCIRYMRSKIVQERVHVAPDTFLLAVYPGQSENQDSDGASGGPLPRFFECTLKRQAQGKDSSGIQWSLGAARGRCLAGISSFQGRLEMQFSISSDVEQASHPSQPAPDIVAVDDTSCRSDELPQQAPPASTRHAERSSLQIDTSHAPRGLAESTPSIAGTLLGSLTDGSTPVPSLSTPTVNSSATPPSPVEAEQHHDPLDRFPAHRGCCRSQQLLALQHQQILENQQQQLRQLQDQICDLQRMLAETRDENARLVVENRRARSLHDSDDRLTTSDLATPTSLRLSTAVEENIKQEFSGNLTATAIEDAFDLAVEDVGENPQHEEVSSNTTEEEEEEEEAEEEEGEKEEKGEKEEENANDVTFPSFQDNDESAVSSLQLSSISQHSEASSLSSVSSSLVGSRLKSFVTRDDTPAPQTVDSQPTGARHESLRTDYRRQTNIHFEAKQEETSREEKQQDTSRETGNNREAIHVVICPHARPYRPGEHCEREQLDDDDDFSRALEPLIGTRLTVPHTPSRDGVVKPSLELGNLTDNNMSLFIPRIKYVVEPNISDSEDDEIQRIELKYKRHSMPSRR